MATYIADYAYPLRSSFAVVSKEIEEAFMRQMTPTPNWAMIKAFVSATPRDVIVRVAFNADDGDTIFTGRVSNVELKLPCYKKLPFTDADRELIFDMCCDEANDMSCRERGEQFMGDLDDDLPEAIGYACEFIDEVGQMLKAIHTKDETFKFNDDEMRDYCAAFAHRFNLVDIQGLKLTDLGGQVMIRWS